MQTNLWKGVVIFEQVSQSYLLASNLSRVLCPRERVSVGVAYIHSAFPSVCLSGGSHLRGGVCKGCSSFAPERYARIDFFSIRRQR